jgi:Zn-dependent membrane protease YugP
MGNRKFSKKSTSPMIILHFRNTLKLYVNFSFPHAYYLFFQQFFLNFIALAICGEAVAVLVYLFLIGIVTTELPRGSAEDALKTELGADCGTWYSGWSAVVPIRA